MFSCSGKSLVLLPARFALPVLSLLVLAHLAAGADGPFMPPTDAVDRPQVNAPTTFEPMFNPLRATQPPAADSALPPGSTINPPATSPANSPATSPPPEATIPVPPTTPTTPPTVPVEVSAAEQITRLEKAMQVDAQRLAKLRVELVAPMSEYRLAEAAFKMVDDELTAVTNQLAAQPVKDPATIAKLQKRADELTKKHKLARERFDLAIQTRKTRQEQITALEGKIKQDQLALDKQTGNTPAPAPSTPATTTTPPNAALVPSAAGDASATATTSTAPTAPPTEAAPPVEASVAPARVMTTPKAPSKELVAAQSDAQQKMEQALEAEREAQSVTDRIVALDKDIELENKLLIATRKKSDIAYQTAQALEEEHEKRRQAGISPQEQLELRDKRRQAENLFREARAEVAEHVDRLNELQSQRAELQGEELAALRDAKTKHEEAKDAEAKVSQLKNPFSIQNLLQWLIDHAPKISVIVIGMLLLRWTLALANQRVVQLMVMRGARGTLQEREDRAKTLVGVFHSAVSMTIIISGLLMICEEVGINVGPLMGGAAVFGLAVAFGAQNLIRDYFYGFVILLENQYKLNDVLKIGDIAGQVEQITLRMTVLRDLEGHVHFIPNGKIDSVTNMTHGWSRAVIEVGIAYGEDADRVMELLLQITAELRLDPEYRSHIIDDAEMLGVDNLGDSAVAIKYVVKTRPLSQWKVRRELLRRIKRRFDELGIEIPFPQRVVTHRYENDETLTQEPMPEPKAWHGRKSA